MRSQPFPNKMLVCGSWARCIRCVVTSRRVPRECARDTKDRLGIKE